MFLSCEVLPEIREFERASTTAVCAYVGPLLAGYLDRLSKATRAGLREAVETGFTNYARKLRPKSQRKLRPGA